MDPRSPYLQPTTRYAPRPQPSPPLPDFYGGGLSYRPNLHNPPLRPLPPPPPQQHQPPPPPPPQQQSYQHHPLPTPPPPPLVNPQNPHFNYNPNHQIRDSSYHMRSHPDAPRRLPEFDHPHYVRASRPDMRVLPENWSYPRGNLDAEPSYPASPIGKIRHDYEGNSRFVDERSVGVEHRPTREDLEYHGRVGQFGSSRDFRVVQGQLSHNSRGFESNSGSYEFRRDLSYDREGVSESQRWVHDREGMRERDMRDFLIDMGTNNEIIDGDGNRMYGGKRENYRSREANIEFERHGSKGSREGSHEFNRTPRKQIQKKSALLRIQKPVYRNREDDRMHYTGYFDDAKSSSHRVKDQNVYMDRVMREEVREGSPVQLDVSFKSNSLVAKAIVTPSSSSTAVSDVKSTPRGSKIRKVLVLEKEDLSSSPIKPSESNVKLHNLVGVRNTPSSFDKDMEQSKDRVTGSAVANVGDTSSLPGSSGKNALLGKVNKKTLPEKGGTNVVSAKASSVKVAKKKKVVKRVVKKVSKPNLGSSSSQRIEKWDEHVNADSCSQVRPKSCGTEKATAVASVNAVDSESCPREVNITSEDKHVEAVSEAMISSKAATAAESDTVYVSNKKRKRNLSTSCLVSSNNEEHKSNEALITENPMENLDDLTNNENLTASPNEITSSYIDREEDFITNISRERELFLLKDDVVRQSSEDRSLSSEKKEIQEATENACKSSTGFNNGLISLQEGITTTDIGTMDGCLNHSCISRDSASVQDGSMGGFLSASFHFANNENFHLTNSGETRVQNIDGGFDSSNHGVKLICNSAEQVKSLGQGTDDPMSEQLSADGVNALFENMGSLNTALPGGSEEHISNVVKNNAIVGMPQLDLSGSKVAMSDLERDNTTNSAQWVDTTLRLSFKDRSPTTISNGRDADGGLEFCTDGIDGFHWCSSGDVSEPVVSVCGTARISSDGTSPRNKNRKFSDSQFEQFSSILSTNEGPLIAGISASAVKVPTSGVDILAQQKLEVAVSGLDSQCTSDLPSLQKGAAALIDACSEGGHPNSGGVVREDLVGDSLISAPSSVGDLVLPEAKSFCSLEMRDGHITNTTGGDGRQNDSMDIDSGMEERINVDVGNKRDMENGSCQISSELKSPDLDERLCSDVENDNHSGFNTSLHPKSNQSSSLEEGNRAPISNTGELPVSTSISYELSEFIPYSLPDTGDSETSPDISGAKIGQILSEKDTGDGKLLVEKPRVQGDSDLPAFISGSRSAKLTSKLDPILQGDHSLSWKRGSSPLQDFRSKNNMLNLKNGGLYRKKSQASQAVSRTYPSRSSFVFNASKTTASSNLLTKPRTWHRTDNSVTSHLPGKKAVTVPAQRQLPKEIPKFQDTSYIRKGNSLVRKPAVVSAQSLVTITRLNASNKDEVMKTSGLDRRNDATEPQNYVMTGGASASFEMSKRPSSPSVPKIPNYTINSLNDRMSSPVVEPLQNHSEETAPHLRSAESNDVSKASEDILKVSETPIVQTDQISTSECQTKSNDGNLGSSKDKSLRYVKRKLNQLVATPNSCGLSLQNVHNATTISTDAYYKRRKNQLIRTPLESHVKQADSKTDENLSSEGQTTLNLISGSSKKRLNKAVTKVGRPSNFSLVWTLSGAQLSKNDGQKVFPYLFPWKRTTYRRSFTANSHSLPATRKLLLSRKRDTVYTRSKHGFSLRKSKVLSVGGFSLKWSKSIESRSRKANEEATLAVAAADRKKREQSGADSAVSRTKRKSTSSRERIFRIGSVRYRMDSSGRTLQRISDDELSASAGSKTENDAKISYIPRRLVIGKNEYVRIGNGNQLIRDPKKRTRTLASEKVRWSLHTARSRLTRKRKYCQFFTRFGKCNKSDGKCLYIHDPSKIAVCTKFLNGLCSNSDCKLTHKVIPERMPDCSYFLQGLCTNRSCTYRHVHVNPSAPTCEGFLRGYCAEGNECRKKHSYVCPIYEATGSCPQGSQCKLHHPKKRGKGKKSLQSRGKKNTHGRYFGSKHIRISDPDRTSVSGKHSAVDGLSVERNIGEYISLDDDEEAVESKEDIEEQMTFSDSDTLDMEMGNLDELIKPIRIMTI